MPLERIKTLPKIALKKRGRVFLPATKAAQSEFDRFGEAAIVHGDLAVRRNQKFHRLYWAMCTYIADALNDGPSGASDWTQEMVSDRLKLATGRAEIVRIPRALQRHYGVEKALKPVSISFAKMDESEFGRFVEASIAYVLSEFGAWVQEHEDWRHVREILNHATQGQAA